MSNNSESVERTVGSNPGSKLESQESNRSDSVNSSKMPARDARTSKPGSYAGSPSGRPDTVPKDSSADAEQSVDDADRDEASRQTSEAQDESGQL